MRRLFNSLPGKLFCQLLVVALVLPSLTLTLATTAQAGQLATRKSWAVLPFVDKSGGSYGQTAAETFTVELSKRADEFKPPIEAQSPATVRRALDKLGLSSPVTDMTSMLRVGQEVSANAVVRGDIVKYRVVDVEGGKRAQVLMRVEVINVASGLAVNGAALQANSSVHPSTVKDDVLINEAIQSGSSDAVRTILSQTLPAGTILNTTESGALINQGTRTGFRAGQQLIVTRGHEQVATAKVKEVESDAAQIDVVRSIKGLQPGDTVQVVFQTPQLAGDFSAAGTAHVVKARSHSNNSALVSVLVILALLVFLVGKNGSNNSPFGGITAEAAQFPDNSGLAAVKVTWTTDLFAKGNSQRYAFQVYRSDVLTSPVLVTPGSVTTAYDTTTARPVTYSNFLGVVGGSSCNYSAAPLTTSAAPVPGVSPGRAYSYAVELVYVLSINDLPGGASSSGGSSATGGTTAGGSGGTTAGGTGGTTAGGTGGGTGGTGGTGGGTGGTTATGSTGGTTSGGTGSTGGTGAQFCYFVSGQTATTGVATPLNRANLTAPANNTVISSATPFSFSSVVGSSPISVQYVLQFSTSPLFPAGATYTSAPFIRQDTGVLSTPSIDTTASSIPVGIRTSLEVFWRIGARNVADSPGPVPDASGERYVFSAPLRFTRSNVITPPPPGG